MVINIYSKTDTGSVREHNEDNFIIGPDPSINNWTNSGHNVLVGSKGVLIAIADGMGGAEAGEIASQIAIDTAKSVYTEKTDPFPIDNFEIIDILKEIILKAHLNINDNILQNPGRNGMGTTIIAGIIYKNNLFVGWCGDSRAYRFNKDGIPRLKHYDLEKLQILTQDHSMVWEYVESGKMTAEEARLNIHSNIITQSLGTKAGEIHPGISIFSLNEGDRLLFCSDGLNSMIADERISEILSIGEPAQQTCELLIDEAIHEGGHDNITLCIIDVLKTDENVVSVANDNVVTEMLQAVPQPINERKKRNIRIIMFIMPILILGFITPFLLTGRFKKSATADTIQGEQMEKNIQEKAKINKTDSVGAAKLKPLGKPANLKKDSTSKKTPSLPENSKVKGNYRKGKSTKTGKYDMQKEQMINQVIYFLNDFRSKKKEISKLENSKTKEAQALKEKIENEIKFINTYFNEKDKDFTKRMVVMEPKFNRTKIENESINLEFKKLKGQAHTPIGESNKKAKDTLRQE